MSFTQTRRSVTLVEMVIVLMILLFLSGIAISLYPDLALRANLTGTLATLRELNNNFVLYETLTQGGMPDNLDLLTDVFSVHRSAFLADMKPALVSPFDVETALGYTTPTGAIVVSAFNVRGVDSFSIHEFPPVNQTFDYLGGPTGEEPLDPVLSLFFEVDDAVVLDKFNVDPTASLPPLNSVYIIFGVGNRASHVGSPTGLMMAPVYLPDVSKTAALNLTGPVSEVRIKEFYSRYLVIYRVSADDLTTARVSFVTCTYAHPLIGVGNMTDVLRKLIAIDEL